MSVEDIKASMRRKNNVLHELTTAEAILSTQYDKPVFIIAELITSGLILICGKPKVGKSWLMLRICIDIASGHKFLGKFEVKPYKVAYFAIEDSASRIQDRLIEMGAEDNLSNILISNELWMLDDEGMDKFEMLVQSNHDIKVWIIDTMQRVKSSDKRINMTPYQEDYEFMGKIQSIAMEYNVAIILIHHSKKAVSDDFVDQALGSTALTGASDIIMMLSQSDQNIKLEVSGRDVERRTMIYSIDKETMQFTIVDDDGTSMKKQSVLQDKIFEFLSNRKGEAFGPTEITAGIGNPTEAGRSSVSRALKKMVNQGLVKSKGIGEYYVESDVYKNSGYGGYGECVEQNIPCIEGVTTHRNTATDDVTVTDISVTSVTTVTDVSNVMLRPEPLVNGSVQP